MVSFQAATLRPPAHSRRKPPLQVWLIRVWEPNPPPEVAKALEWILVTSVPTTFARRAKFPRFRSKKRETPIFRIPVASVRSV
jgi:hypothetical protein